MCVHISMVYSGLVILQLLMSIVTFSFIGTTVKLTRSGHNPEAYSYFIIFTCQKPLEHLLILGFSLFFLQFSTLQNNSEDIKPMK